MKFAKRIPALLLTLSLALGLAGCGSATTSSSSQPGGTSGAAQSSSTSGQAAKPVLLAVSFGSSYNETREATIDVIEEKLAAAYPEYEVRRAFTAQIVIDILKEREKMEIDNMTQAMDRLVADGVKDVLIQPTHVMPGYEYDDVCAEAAKYVDKFDSLVIGDPLLTTDRDFDTMVNILQEETTAYNQKDTAVVFMGHGTHHKANATYARLEERLHAKGLTNYFVGTVEGSPLVDEVIGSVKATDAKKVVLLPLMIVAGDHANNDMAGDEDDSWKSAFTAAGYEVECVLKGLGEYPGVQQAIIDHAAAAVSR